MKMPFGKYQGRAITNIPRDYLEWALEYMTALRPDQLREIKNLLDKYKSMERQKR